MCASSPDLRQRDCHALLPVSWLVFRYFSFSFGHQTLFFTAVCLCACRTGGSGLDNTVVLRSRLTVLVQVPWSKMTDAQGNKVIVCDNGTGFVKCGFAGANFPSHIFPSLVGRPILRSSTKVGNIELKVLALQYSSACA